MKNSIHKLAEEAHSLTCTLPKWRVSVHRSYIKDDVENGDEQSLESLIRAGHQKIAIHVAKFIPLMPKKDQGKYQKRYERAVERGSKELLFNLYKALRLRYNRSIKNHPNGDVVHF